MNRLSGNGGIRRAGIVGAMAVAMAALIPVGDANAVNRVDCGNRTDFAKIYNYNYTSTLCFSNDGWTAVRIYGVDQINAGNNKVVTFLANGFGSWTILPWQNYSFSYSLGHEVDMIDITLSRF